MTSYKRFYYLLLFHIHFSYGCYWLNGSFLIFPYVSLWFNVLILLFDVFTPYDSYACIRFIRLFPACTFSPVTPCQHYLTKGLAPLSGVCLV